MAGDVVGKAVYEVSTDNTGLQKGLNDAESGLKRTGATADRTGKSIDGALGKKSQASAKGLAGSLKGVEDRFTGINKQGGLAKSILGGVGLGVGVAAFQALGSAIGSVTDFIGGAISAAMEEEASIAALTKSIEENSAGWDGNIKAVEKVIEARQDLAFADDEQRDSLRTLVAVTGDVNKALALQRQAMDLARLRGMSLAEAGTLIGKVYGGNVSILRRYGIQLDKGATSAEALAAIQKMSAGQAEAFAETTAGTFQSLQIAIDNIVEDIGMQLLPLMKDLAKTAKSDLVPAIKAILAQTAAVGTFVDLLAKAARGDLAGVIKLGEEIGRGTLVDWLEEATDQTDALIEAWGGLANEMGTMPDARTIPWLAALTDAQREALLAVETLPGDLRAALMEGAPAVAAGAGVMVEPLPETARDAVRAATRALAAYPGAVETSLVRGKVKIHRVLSDAKREARLGAAGIMWALNHPNGDKNLGEQYASDIAKSEKRRRRAIREGNTTALALIDAHLADVRAKQAALNATVWKYRIEIMQTVASRHDEGGAGSQQRAASGGYRFPGWSGTVGENGPERVRLLSTGGMSVLASQGSNSAGSSTVRHVVDLGESTIAALRRAGASWSDVGTVAAVAGASIASPGQAIRRWRS